MTMVMENMPLGDWASPKQFLSSWSALGNLAEGTLMSQGYCRAAWSLISSALARLSGHCCNSYWPKSYHRAGEAPFYFSPWSHPNGVLAHNVSASAHGCLSSLGTIPVPTLSFVISRSISEDRCYSHFSWLWRKRTYSQINQTNENID